MDSSTTTSPSQAFQREPLDFIDLSRRVLHVAHRGAARIEFLREVSRMMLEFSGCETIELRLTHGDLRYRWQAKMQPEWFDFQLLAPSGGAASVAPSGEGRACWYDSLVDAMIRGESPSPIGGSTRRGSIWTGDAPAGSLAVVPFEVGEASPGLLVLSSPRMHMITAKNIEFYEAVAQTIGLAVNDRRAQHALRERVKELSCLYAVARIFEDVNDSIGANLQRAVAVLPPAWQHPEILVARITLDEVDYPVGDLPRAIHRQQAEITVGGVRRGVVEVGYTEERPEFAEGPFLKEEEHLIAAVAREVGLFVLRHEARHEKQRLAEQLRHAERLATLGQLAAGIAHSINEPLGGVLGFSQLARKAEGLPAGVADDLDKIIHAALHARDIVHNLMLFARQSPPSRAWVSLNTIVERCLSMLASRLSQGGVHVVSELGPRAPLIHADEVQLHQIVVNLCINALQAMPRGGTLTVRTHAEPDHLVLTVRDTGSGIPAEVSARIFEPFFTTKGPEEGTGLGLSVVHGIVAAHGGTIRFDTKPGEGTTFEVRLPTSSATAAAPGAPDHA
jgi:signal transduction histidine kinase